MSYYDRKSILHLDGTPIFQTAEDRESEQAVALLLEKHYRCEMHRFGELSAVDWYAVRRGRMVGIAELKTRSHASDKYPTVYLNVRKWLALLLSSIGLGVPALFVVRFTDQIRRIRVGKINASRVILGGTTEIVKSRSDREPLIEVPVEEMRVLHDPQKD
jgi:hypothetical protein